MRKIQVFVNRNGDVVATGPAPATEVDKSTGPVLAGFAPVSGADNLTAYEMLIGEDLALNRDLRNADEFHARVAERVRAAKDLKQIDFRKYVIPPKTQA